MKKAIFSLLVLLAFCVRAQDSYWTHYNVVVEPQNVDMRYKLMDDYFSANKTDGVTVSLWENLINPYHLTTKAQGSKSPTAP